MCGRFTLRHPDKTDFGQLGLADVPNLFTSFNVAPSQMVASVREHPGRELVLLQWGLIPAWSKEPKGFINARADSVAEKPAFRSAFRKRRCLVLADGFYEWQKTDGAKQPYFFRMADDALFFFAGLWEHWEREGEVIESCALMTTEANDVVRPVHDRMPVILRPDCYEAWLDPQLQDVERLKAMLRPFEARPMTAYPVGTFVNKPSNNNPRCIEPLAGDGGGLFRA